MKNDTALLIFARTASEESKHKSFKASRPFFQQQNATILRLAKSSGLTFFWIDENYQIGNTFEERYLNAKQSIFNKGYSKVISIGNDAPELELKHIQNAVESLHHNQVCFGPSRDGGFYLWGIQKEVFQKNVFINFSWKTNTLLAEIKKYLKVHSIPASYLDILTDLDQRKDAYYFLTSVSISDQILSILLRMLEDRSTESHRFIPYSPLNYTEVYYNKGSPVLAG